MPRASRGLAESGVSRYLRNPGPGGTGLRLVKRRLAWTDKVLISEYSDFSGRFSQGGLRSGGDGVFGGAFLLVDCGISGDCLL